MLLTNAFMQIRRRDVFLDEEPCLTQLTVYHYCRQNSIFTDMYPLLYLGTPRSSYTLSQS